MAGGSREDRLVDQLFKSPSRCHNNTPKNTITTLKSACTDKSKYGDRRNDESKSIKAMLGQREGEGSRKYSRALPTPLHWSTNIKRMVTKWRTGGRRVGMVVGVAVEGATWREL